MGTAPLTPRWKSLEDHKTILFWILSEGVCTVAEMLLHAWVTGRGLDTDWGTTLCTAGLSDLSGSLPSGLTLTGVEAQRWLWGPEVAFNP